MILKCTLVYMKSTLYSRPILMKLEFSRYIFENNPQISNFMKIRPVGAELFYADGQTGRQTDRLDEANIASRTFAKEPKNTP